MPSSIATQAKLGVFEGDTFEKTKGPGLVLDGTGRIFRAFVWSVEDRVVTMSTFYDMQAKGRRFPVSTADLAEFWTLTVPNPNMRMRAAEALRA